MTSKYSQFTPLPPGQSLPNLLSSLEDIEKGRSGIPQPSNRKGLRENEDTVLLAKTLSVCSTLTSAGTGDSVESKMNTPAHKHTRESKTPVVSSTMISSLFSRDSKEGTGEVVNNSYKSFQQQAEQGIQNSLFGAVITAGDKQQRGEYTCPKIDPLSNSDMPPHIQDFKQQYLEAEGSRLKLPLLSQLSPRTRKRISLLPKSTEHEQEKIEEYSNIGRPKEKVAVKDTDVDLSASFQHRSIPVSKKQMASNSPIFKKLGKVILKNKNQQYRKNQGRSNGMMLIFLCNIWKTSLPFSCCQADSIC